MSMDPLSLLSPKQQKFLANVQQYTKDIKAVIIQSPGEISVRLETENSEAAKFVPQIESGIINSVAQTLHLMFNIVGKIERGKPSGQP